MCSSNNQPWELQSPADCESHSDVLAVKWRYQVLRVPDPALRQVVSPCWGAVRNPCLQIQAEVLGSAEWLRQMYACCLQCLLLIRALSELICRLLGTELSLILTRAPRLVTVNQSAP